MKLHENKSLFQEAIQAASQQFEMREIYVEKDYWVTVALYHIFHSPIADQVVFKGGTALSKCHRLIERFSEDIDLVVLRNENETVSCYIIEMMEAQGQEKLIKEYTLDPFPIQVLAKERTLCEKIMSLVRFSRTEEPIEDLKNKIRHIYDIHLMLMNKDISGFFEGSEFDAMLTRVGKDDRISFKNNNKWLQTHPSTAMIFAAPQD